MKISFILLAYDMQREVPRTLQSLMCQAELTQDDFEVVLIENKSRNLLDVEHLKTICPKLRYYLNDKNPSSPAYAMNLGLQYSSGDIVAFCIDGARLLSPGIGKGILNAALLYDKFIVSTHAYHLGSEPQNQSVPEGRYNQLIEDALLEKIDWPNAAYRLFEISVFAASSRRGWFGPIAESNCIAMPRESAIALGGYDESFTTLGGGYVNLDFYKRAQTLDGHQFVSLLGEGTFHQVHGGVATNNNDAPRDAYKDEYLRLRGETFRLNPLPENTVYLGEINPSARTFLYQSCNNIK